MKPGIREKWMLEATNLSDLICKMVQIITNLFISQELVIITEKKKKSSFLKFKVKGATSNKCPYY